MVYKPPQSYAGGRHLWGTEPLTKSDREKGLKDPCYNDGLLEVRSMHSFWLRLARTIYKYGVYTVFLAGKSPNIRCIYI